MQLKQVKSGVLPKDRTPAVVFPLKCAGYGLMRTLGRHGVPVIGLSVNPTSVLTSRYCRQAYLVTNPTQDPMGFVESLEALGERLGRRTVLYMAEDLYVYLVVHHRRRLERYFHYPYVSDEILRRCFNKRDMLDCAERAGVPIPTTWYPADTAEVTAKAERWMYPSLIKPLVSRFSFNGDRVSHVYAFPRLFGGKAIPVNSPEELMTAYARVQATGIASCVQEWIPGRSDQLYNVKAFVWEGAIHSYMTSRKLRQQPEDFGTCTVREATDTPAIAEYGRRLVRAIGYHGVCSIEFKYDAREGRYKLIELNPRPDHSHGISEVCGVPIVHLLYRQLIGDPPPPMRQTNFRCHWWDLRDDFLYYFIRYRREHHPEWALSWRQWLGSIRWPVTEAFWCADDPLPGVCRLAALMGRVVRAGARRLAMGLLRLLAPKMHRARLEALRLRRTR